MGVDITKLLYDRTQRDSGGQWTYRPDDYRIYANHVCRGAGGGAEKEQEGSGDDDDAGGDDADDIYLELDPGSGEPARAGLSQPPVGSQTTCMGMRQGQGQKGRE